MPLLKKTETVAGGSTLSSILAGSPWEFLDPGWQLTFAAAASAGGLTCTFLMNNVELAKDVEVSQLVDGEPFGWRGGYMLLDTATPNIQRNRPIITFTNTTSGDLTLYWTVYLSQIGVVAA